MVIYKIINLTNGKFYVGSTIDEKARFRTHKRKLMAGTHHCIPLQNAWNKYGETSFIFRTIEVVDSREALMLREQQLLDEHHGTERCYNLARYVDNSTRGKQHTAQHKAKLSAALKAHYAANVHHRTGKPHTEESIAKMRENRAGIAMSEETKDKLRAANIGKVASEETRAKLSAMRKGKEKAPEHIAKYNKPILEVSSGEVFPSLKAVKDRFGLSPAMLAKALAADRPLIRGKNAGRHFRYA